MIGVDPGTRAASASITMTHRRRLRLRPSCPNHDRYAAGSGPIVEWGFRQTSIIACCTAHIGPMGVAKNVVMTA
jgi:hypothetical protein